MIVAIASQMIPFYAPSHAAPSKMVVESPPKLQGEASTDVYTAGLLAGKWSGTIARGGRPEAPIEVYFDDSQQPLIRATFFVGNSEGFPHYTTGSFNALEKSLGSRDYYTPSCANAAAWWAKPIRRYSLSLVQNDSALIGTCNPDDCPETVIIELHKKSSQIDSTKIEPPPSYYRPYKFSPGGAPIPNR